MERRIEYGWRLREIMAARGMNTIADLLPHLAERGIHLSASQVYRLVGATPERINITTLAAILDTVDTSEAHPTTGLCTL
jgi:Cro/C1-type HTH DNA-binding domain